MNSGDTYPLDQVQTGNYYDKFNSKNPITRYLMNGFKQNFQALFSMTAPHINSIFELGCGEGYMLEMMQSLKPVKMDGLDIDIPLLKDAEQRVPTASFILGDGHQLPYPNQQFDLVVACEVLEHVNDPERVLKEMQRVGSRYFIMSVPREPIWRILNVARGHYLKDLGNTPGHVNHWSTSSFVKMVGNYFNVLEVRNPFPWTMILCELRS